MSRGLLFAVLIVLAVVCLLLLGRGQPDREASPSTTSGEAEITAPSDHPAPRQTEPEIETSESTIAEPSVAVPIEPTAPKLCSVSGRVVDPRNQPVRGATVYLAHDDEWVQGELDVDLLPYDGDTHKRIEITTDAAGGFRAETLKPGKLRYAVRADGYAPFSTEVVDLLPGADRDLGDLVIERGLVLEGIVIDSDGVGVPDAVLLREDHVQVGFGPGFRYAPLATTNATGHFRVTTLAPGAWRILVDTDDYPPAWFQGEHFEAGVSAGHVFQLTGGWSIAGWVEVPGWSEYVGYSVQLKIKDDRTKGLDLRYEQRAATVQCDADGRFEARRLYAIDADTQYSLQAFRKSGRLLSRASEIIEARVGEQNVRLHCEADAGVVFELRDAASGQPVAPTTVYLIVNGNNHIDLTERGSVQELAPGRYQVPDITRPSKASAFKVRVHVDGYRDYVRRKLDLVAGQVRDLGVFELESAAVVAVRVVDSSDKTPIEGAEVARTTSKFAPMFGGGNAGLPEFHFDPSRVKAKTDSDGLARVTLAFGHENYVTVTHAAFAPAIEGPVPIEASKDRELDIELHNGATVRVRVEDSNGEPVPGLRVRCKSVTWLEEIANSRPFPSGSLAFDDTDAAGRIIFEHLPIGKTELALTRETGVQMTESVELRPGDDREVVFVIPLRTSLEVLVREAGQPLVDASVEIHVEKLDDDGRPVPIWRSQAIARQDTTGSGFALFKDVEVGTYELVLRHKTRALYAVQSIDVDPERASVSVDLAVTRASGSVRCHDAAGDGAVVGPAFAYVVAAGNADDYVWSTVLQHAARADGSSAHSAAWVPIDDRGNFAFDRLPSGYPLRVGVVVPDHQLALSEVFDVRPGEDRQLGEFIVRRAGALEFTLDLAENQRAASWSLRVELEYAGDAVAKPQTMRVGIPMGGEPRRVESLAPGDWTARVVSVMRQGRPQSETRVQIRAGETTTVTLPLPK